MDKFLEKYNLPKLNEEAESLNRPITADENETVIKKLLTHNSPRPDSFTGEFYRAFKGELIQTLHRLFLKIQEVGRPVSYTHLTLPTNVSMCRSRWSPYH